MYVMISSVSNPSVSFIYASTGPLSSTGPLPVQLKRSYRLHSSIKAYFVGEKL